MNDKQQWMLEEFAGCDAQADDSAMKAKGSIWLFGIEHGWDADADKREAENNIEKDMYTAKYQIENFSYNRNAFKLLTVIDGHPIEEWKQYAEKHQPFARGSQGFFKGNLYPHPCHNVDTWTDEAEKATGFASKDEYQNWCRKYRFEVIRQWVEEYAPSIFIGVGISCRKDFCQAVFGKKNIKILEHNSKEEMPTDTHPKRIIYVPGEDLKFFVIPHLSYEHSSRPYCLSSDKSIEWAGNFIRKLKND
jgi:hypothetical protein